MTSILLPSLQRLLAVAILLVLITAIWVLVAGPLVGLVLDRRSDIDALTERLANLQAITARTPVLERQERDLTLRLADGRGFWTGASATAIAASVQDLLRQVVVANGGVVKSSAEQRPTSEQSSQAVQVRLRIEGPLDTVQKTLAAIEDARPALFVDSLTILAQDGGGSPDKRPTLGVDLQVIGYRALSRP